VRLRQRHGRRNSCDLTLTGAVPWELHIEGGATRLTTDVSALRLTSLHITGGVSQTRLRLPQPAGTVPLRIDAGVSNLRIERPSAAAIQLYVHRASSHITLDGVRLNAVGGGTEWASPDYASAGDRYSVELGGAASDVSISATEHEPAAGGDENTSLDTQMRNWFAAQPPAKYPNLVALAGILADSDLDRRFEIGLRIMLDGLERRLTETGRQPPDAGASAG
jgi:hypothetical protein